MTEPAEQTMKRTTVGSSDEGTWRHRLPAIPDEQQGLLLGLLGVLAFSFTLPFSRIAAPQLGGLWVGIERAVLAAALASVILFARHESWPERRHWRPICIAALGTVLGFGPLSSLAMQYLPASHGIVVVGLLPAATAVMAVLRAGEQDHRRE
ncbi:MAG TPA: EamA family transporter, partial [Thermomicrobiales bacterium]|nr:EamA family transporter [Thermomicrobiales bacterium]